MGLIHLEDMEFYAYHGCFKEEQIAGNWFLVNLILKTDMEKPSGSDLIADALNYQTVYHLVEIEMAITSHLLEHIGGRILNALFANFNQLEQATVKISKMNPPLGGRIKSVSIEITQTRSLL
jgi:7,8-dihydroneopterin aldolase/epimerase/oxygenase